MNYFAAQFKKDLQKQSLSATSIKNYLADLRSFFRWLKKASKSSNLKISLFTPQAFQAYLNYLKLKNSPLATVKRRLATLRRFGRFLRTAGLTASNPTVKLKNPAPQPTVQQILARFKRYLNNQKMSKSTVKNYLADLNQFCQWVSKCP